MQFLITVSFDRRMAQKNAVNSPTKFMVDISHETDSANTTKWLVRLKLSIRREESNKSNQLTNKFQRRAVAIDIDDHPKRQQYVDTVQELPLQDTVDAVIQLTFGIHVEMQNGALNRIAFRQRLCPISILARQIRTCESNSIFNVSNRKPRQIAVTV